MSQKRKKPFDLPTALLCVGPILVLTLLTAVWVRGGVARKELKDAAQSGNLPKLTALLNHGTNINEQNGSGETALGYAANARQYDAVKLLLDRGAKVNFSGQNLEASALAMACLGAMNGGNSGSNDRVVKLLLEHGADPNPKQSDWTLLAYMAQTHNTNTALLLVSQGADVNGIMNGYPVLWYAVLNNDTPLIEALLAKGAHPNVQDKHNHDTPLIQAVQNGSVSHMKLLLTYGARTDLKDKLGMTALQWAIKQKNQQEIAILKNVGAKQ